MVSAGSNGALLVALRCERPASVPPLAGSHPRRIGGTPCGRAASTMSGSEAFKVAAKRVTYNKNQPTCVRPKPRPE